jgi:hypothetical protein
MQVRTDSAVNPAVKHFYVYNDNAKKFFSTNALQNYSIAFKHLSDMHIKNKTKSIVHLYLQQVIPYNCVFNSTKKKLFLYINNYCNKKGKYSNTNAYTLPVVKNVLYA